MKTFYIPFAILLILFISCTKEMTDSDKPEITDSTKIYLVTIQGYIQKGPFINGSRITISELDSGLNATGRNFYSTIKNDLGSFSIDSVSLNSNYVELSADGFYFNEVSGQISNERIVLTGIVDISQKSTINVNLLTCLEKDRVLYLIKQGKTFSEAKNQAQKEILQIFNIEKDSLSYSETMNISKGGDGDAILLAISAILQGKRTVGELSKLIADIINDIREDGKLDSEPLQSEIINQAKLINWESVKNNVSAKYAFLGVQAGSTDKFQHYADYFINSTTFPNTLKIEYPKAGKYGLNILSFPNDTTIGIDKYVRYSLSAVLPKNCSLKVKITTLEGLWFTSTFDNQGWLVNTSEQQFSSTTEGEIDLKLVFSDHGSAKVEIFENNSIVPSISKTFSWSGSGVPSANSKYGINILGLNDSTTLAIDTQYGIAVTRTDGNKELKIGISVSDGLKIIFDSTKMENFKLIPDEQQYYKYFLTNKGTDLTSDAAISFFGSGFILLNTGEDQLFFFVNRMKK